MTDEKILEVVPKIIKKIPYKSIILTNKEYNERYSNDINMNKLKAILHNKVLFNLKNENPNYDIIIVDEFAKEHTYYSYLKDAPNIVRNISFYTKGEDKHLAVAAASLISRYIFIKEYEKLNKEYNIIFPKGAGELVDEVGRNIVKKYGKDELNKIAKITFKNTEKILEK